MPKHIESDINDAASSDASRFFEIDSIPPHPSTDMS
jgi:hypothetical protein